MQTHRTRKVFFVVTLLGLCVVGTRGESHAADPIQIDFEDLPAGTEVTTQYSARGLGVVFIDAVIERVSEAHSGRQVLREHGDSRNEFSPGPLGLSFTSPQSQVSLFAAAFKYVPGPGTLTAYDGTGRVVAQDGPKPVSLGIYDTLFSVTTPSPSIVRVTFELALGGFEAIDDLQFSGEAPPPPPTTSPIVTIDLPKDGAEVDADTIAVSGFVRGEGLLPTATLTEAARLPPGFPTVSTLIPLAPTPTPTTATFNVPFGTLPLGPMAITVAAQNTAGLIGSDTVRITNFPAAIRTRFASEGGAGVFGDFRWGLFKPGCKVAVYEHAAISLAGDGFATLVIHGRILEKWLIVTDTRLGGDATLGCPTDEPHTPPGGGGVAQTFERGRVYANDPLGDFYVARVFVDAIERLGGETATGLPMNDPLEGTGGGPRTGLFQQFTRVGQEGLPSTLEIRASEFPGEIFGVEPTLTVERPGGDLQDLRDANLLLTFRTPAIWERFPCSGSGPWTCTVTPTPRRTDVQLDTFGRVPAGCGGRTYLRSRISSGGVSGVLEWVPVIDDYANTSILGFRRKHGFISSSDNPLTHEYSNDALIKPIPRPEFFNLLGGEAIDERQLEMETEEYFVNYFYTAYGVPQAGDLIFANGRWIVDCGHRPANTEIHPWSVLASHYTETVCNRPVTQTNIWVGGFFVGEPVQFDIFPPPRPTPNASLVLHKPRDSESAIDVEVQYAVLSDHVQVTLSSETRREVPVDSDTGQMFWQTGRGYMGRWRLFWSVPGVTDPTCAPPSTGGGGGGGPETPMQVCRAAGCVWSGSKACCTCRISQFIPVCTLTQD